MSIDTKALLLYGCYVYCSALRVSIDINHCYSMGVTYVAVACGCIYILKHCFVWMLLMLKWLACVYRHQSTVTLWVLRMLQWLACVYRYQRNVCLCVSCVTVLCVCS
jgi:hypothetical protein